MTKRKRTCASAQPFVVEAPHVLWGDARDKTLSRIAREGCPMIDSRQFEYVSNARLDEAKFSESLLVCGATLWVQNADDDGSILSTTSTLKQRLIRAEYYGGKLVDGAKVGASKGVKGLTLTKKVAFNAAEKRKNEMIKGTDVALHAAEKGTKTIVKGVEGLLPIHECESVTSTITHAPSDERKTRKKSKLKSLLSPKKFGNKLRRRKHKAAEDGHSIDGSGASLDNHSLGNKSAALDSGQVSDASKRSVVAEVHSDAQRLHEGVGSLNGDEDLDALADKGILSPNSSKDDWNEFTLVKPAPCALLVDDIINIRILSFPDKNDVIASFPISVASVMAQRSKDSRADDPMKPSELTTTFIQEPSAQLLRWGVELKVTLRAVEVKPQVPRVIRTKVRIDDELDLIRHKMKQLGKNRDEIKEELKAKEDQLVKEENDLNWAIVHYGYGKGENDGDEQREIRRRQMFYCDREHNIIALKMKRRADLTDDEREMVSDNLFDPTSMSKKYSHEDLLRLLEQLENAFPVIGKANAIAERAFLSSSIAAKTKNGVDSGYNAFTKACLALAQSLDSCLGGLTENSTLLAVEQKVNDSLTGGIRLPITKDEVKMWCSQTAERLSTHAKSASATDASVRSSVAMMQSIIAKSALGPGVIFSQDDDESNREETKLDEDEIALSLSERKSADSVEDLHLLADWANRIASQLEVCAQELDDDQDSEILDLIGHGGKAADQPKQALPSNETDQEHSGDQDAALALKEEKEKIPIPHKREPNVMSKSRFREATSISTLKDALPKSKADRKSNIETLLKIAKDRSPIQVLLKNAKETNLRQANMETSSSATTLVNSPLLVAVLAIGAAVVIRSCIFFWPMFREEYFNPEEGYLHQLWDQTVHLARDRLRR